jgi:hypothetical protein
MTTAATYCANHPDRETSLRCNNCGKLICSQCAIHTPTGYRCRECVRGRQKVFETANVADYVVAFVVATLLSGVGAFLASFIGFFTLFLAPAAGGIIGEAVRAVTGRRRSTLLFQIAAGGVAVGAAPFVLGPLLGLINGGGGFGGIFGLLWPLLYATLASSAAYYRLAGIQMNR